MFIYVCVNEWGQLSNKEGEKKTTTTLQRLPWQRWAEEQFGFHCETQHPGAEREWSAFLRSAASPCQQISWHQPFFSPSPLFPQQQHRYVARRGDRVAGNVDERGADRKFGFRLSALFRKLCYVMLERLDGNREKGGRGWGHTAQLDWKLSKKQTLFNGTPHTNNSHLKCSFKCTER